MRRKILLFGALAGAVLLVVSTGAVTQQSGDTVEGTDIVLRPADGPNGDYALMNDGEIELRFGPDNPDVDGDGVNAGTVTPVHRVFTITYTGDQGAEVYLTDGNDDITFYRGDDTGESLEGAENAVELGPEERVAVGVLIDARDGTSVENVDDFTVHANVTEPGDVETTATETTTPETTVTETAVPETTVTETAVPETTVTETAVPETTPTETETTTTETETATETDDGGGDGGGSGGGGTGETNIQSLPTPTETPIPDDDDGDSPTDTPTTATTTTDVEPSGTDTDDGSAVNTTAGPAAEPPGTTTTTEALTAENPAQDPGTGQTVSFSLGDIPVWLILLALLGVAAVAKTWQYATGK